MLQLRETECVGKSKTGLRLWKRKKLELHGATAAKNGVAATGNGVAAAGNGVVAAKKRCCRCRKKVL